MYECISAALQYVFYNGVFPFTHFTLFQIWQLLRFGYCTFRIELFILKEILVPGYIAIQYNIQ